MYYFPDTRESLLGRVDPRWKLAALVTATLVAAFLQMPFPSLAALIGTWLLAWLGRLPWRWYVRRMGGVALALAIFLAWLPFFQPDQGWLLHVGPLRLSVPGLILAAVLLMKTVAVVTLMLVLWATAPLPATCKAAYALKVPGLLVHLTVLTYRYVFLLGEEFGRLRIALRVRGFRQRADVHSLRTVGQVAGTLLIRGQERAERVSQAMRCRGFDGTFRALATFQTHWLDVAVFAAIVTAAALVLCWDLGTLFS